MLDFEVTCVYLKNTCICVRREELVQIKGKEEAFFELVPGGMTLTKPKAKLKAGKNRGEKTKKKTEPLTFPFIKM